MNTDRLHSITDGIIAIAATIMVLELNVPTNISLDELVEQWPKFLAHFNSFFLIFTLWYNHYLQLKKLEYASVSIVFLTGLWLSFVSLLPFSTGWISAQPQGTTAHLFYAVNLALCFLVYQFILLRLVRDGIDTRLKESYINKAGIPIYLGLAIAFVLAFFWPTSSLFMEVAIILYNIFMIFLWSDKKKSRMRSSGK